MKSLEFSLIAGTNILIKELNIELRQPRLKELALVGEDTVSELIAYLSIDREELLGEDATEEEKEALTEMLIFQGLLLKSENRGMITILLGMIFQDYEFDINEETQEIILKRDGVEVSINAEEFLVLRKYIKAIFIREVAEKKDYNPQSKKAREIAEKIAKSKEKIQSRKPNKFEGRSMMSVQISTVSVAMGISVEEIVSEYTMYQLQDAYQRIAKKEAYESALKAIAAGAEDVEVEDWRDPL